MMADTGSSTPTCQFCGANLIFHGQTSCQACGKDLSGRAQSAGPAGSIWGASSPDSASSVANSTEIAGATAQEVAAGGAPSASAAEGTGAMGFAVTPAPGQQRSTTWSSTTTSSTPGPEGGPSREHPHGQSRSHAAVPTERPESPPTSPVPAPSPGDSHWAPNPRWVQDSRRQPNARRTQNSGAGCMAFAGIALAIVGLVGFVGLGWT